LEPVRSFLKLWHQNAFHFFDEQLVLCRAQALLFIIQIIFWQFSHDGMKSEHN